MILSPLDLLALAWFLVAWAGYSVLLDRTPLGRRSLTALMTDERRRWMETMAQREQRIVDAALIGGLQQGTAFFASTSLLAVGGALTLMRAAEEMTLLARALPFAVETSRTLWEAKVFGLAMILVYAFFKFAWSYRLFNYVAILIGGTPQPVVGNEAEALEQARKAGAMQTVAAGHFNRGLRAFFFALAFIGWLLSPIALLVSTTAVVIVLYRRQFGSAAALALAVETTDAAAQNNRPLA